MGAGARFHFANVLRRQCALPQKKFGVFLRLDIVGDDCEAVLGPEALTEAIYKCRLP